MNKHTRPTSTFERYLRPTVALVFITIFAITGPHNSASESRDDRCPEVARVCSYEPPSDVQADRNECFRAERAERGIPGDRTAYVAWYEANKGTPAQIDWSAAHKACVDSNPNPGGKWNTETLVFVDWK